MKKILQKSLCRLHALLLLVVMFVAGNSAAWAQDWQEVTQNALNANSGFTIIDANADGTTWLVDTYSGYIRYSWNSSNAANDYCVLDGEELTAGATYRVSFDVKRASYTEKFKIVCGTSASASQLTTVLLDTTIPTNSFATYSGTFTAPTTGTYYFAIQAVSDANQYYLYAQNYKLEVDAATLPAGPDDGSVKSTLNFASTSWNLSVNGDSSVPTSGCHFDTRDVFTNADGVTMTLTNVASRGEGGLNSERKGTGYAQSWPNECYYSQYVNGYFAMYFCNGEGFTINAPSGYSITKIVVNRASSSYAMTSLIIDGVQNNDGTKGTWTGEAESVAFSTISGDANKRILVSNIQVTLMPKALAEAVEYTVNFVGAPAGAEVTLDDQTLTADNNTYEVAKKLGTSDLVVVDPAGYWTEVDFDGEDTFTVTYHAYNYYNVTVSGAVGGALVYDDVEYTSGQIESKNVLTLGDVEAKKVAGYDADVTLEGSTFTVTYTAYPTVAIGSNAVDNEGNYWTTFSFHHPVSFADGVTPCIVTDANNGVLTIQEFESQNNNYTYDLDFTTGAYSGSSFTAMDGKLTVTGVNWIFNTGYGYAETANTEDWTTITFTLADDYDGVIKSIRFLTATDGNSAWFNYDGGYMNNWSEIPVNGKTMTIGAWYDQMIKHFYLDIEEVEIPVIPANTGILVKADEAKANIVYTVHEAGEENVDVTSNLLVAGCTTPSYGWDNANKLYYKLAWASSAYDKLGFYWGVDGGHSIVANPNKAYLVLDAAAGSNLRAFTFDGDNTVTAIEGINAEADNTPVFNLQGQRVNTAKAGVYVKNGRKFIVK